MRRWKLSCRVVVSVSIILNKQSQGTQSGSATLLKTWNKNIISIFLGSLREKQVKTLSTRNQTKAAIASPSFGVTPFVLLKHAVVV